MVFCNHHKKCKEVDKRVINALKIAFIINLLLTFFEIGFGLYAKSVALVGDGLHNIGDTISILLVVVVCILGGRVANKKYSYGFKRAEVIGNLVNLVLLFLSGIFLFYKGVQKIIFPVTTNGTVVMYVAILAGLINFITALILLKYSFNNRNIKVIFVHNFSDALSSIGVFISGLFSLLLGWYFIDGIVAVLISIYLFIQIGLNLPPVLNVLMNASPNGLDMNMIKERLKEIKDVKDVHHIHLWSMEENEVSFNCHVVSDNSDVLEEIKDILENEFKIYHSYIQIEKRNCDSEEGIF